MPYHGYPADVKDNDSSEQCDIFKSNGFLISTKFRGSSSLFRIDHFYTGPSHYAMNGQSWSSHLARDWWFANAVLGIFVPSQTPALRACLSKVVRPDEVRVWWEKQTTLLCYIGWSGFCFPECRHDLGTALLAGDFNSHHSFTLNNEHPTSGTLHDLFGNSTSLPRSGVSGEIYFSIPTNNILQGCLYQSLSAAAFHISFPGFSWSSLLGDAFDALHPSSPQCRWRLKEKRSRCHLNSVNRKCL